ncbi:hypothetical protein [Granulicella sibirica]|uniref:Lipoprotein n=1 Tax=Granulicella sibirica TaxID=2479048 RepID=A0A4Q0T2D7_9BACT|nr:hypothetical protein [Granulicella sibirica]RXH57367.1 hypothetical protein GRAN_0677 [Granulicella sibirica]
MMNPMRKRIRFGVAFLPLSSLLLLTGCSSSVSPAPTVAAIADQSSTGNWQIGAFQATATGLVAKTPVFAGILTFDGAEVSGHLRPVALAGMTPCVPSSAVIDVAGTVDAQRRVSFASANLPGGILSVSGTLAEDGKSLTSASYSVAGGTCGFAQPASGLAISVSPVALFTLPAGSHSGNVTTGDPESPTVPVTATVTTSNASPDGSMYDLTGKIAFIGNAAQCVVGDEEGTGTVSGSAVTINSGNVVTNGIIPSDGSSITLSYSFNSGDCMGSTGSGVLYPVAAH